MPGRKKTVIEFDHYELNNLVREKYPFLRDYDFVADQECGNDSSHTFSASGEEFTDEEWEELQRKGWGTHQTFQILDRLCKDGHIEPGDYLIEVCW